MTTLVFLGTGFTPCLYLWVVVFLEGLTVTFGDDMSESDKIDVLCEQITDMLNRRGIDLEDSVEIASRMFVGYSAERFGLTKEVEESTDILQKMRQRVKAVEAELNHMVHEAIIRFAERN